MNWQELQERINDLLKELEDQINGSDDEEDQEDDSGESVASLLDKFKEGLANILGDVEESEDIENRIRRLETMADDRTLALKVLAAWREQLAKVVDVEELTVDDETIVEDTLTKLSEIEIPSTEELEAKVDELTQELDTLKTELAAKEAEAAAEARLEELKEAGITIPESRLESTKEKIRGMDDEAFADYKQELIDFIGAKEDPGDDEEEDKDLEESFASYRRSRGRLVTEENDPSGKPIEDAIKVLFEKDEE